MSRRGDAYKQYTEVSYAGRQLLNKHKLDEYGIWHIKGEDPNCDMGGYHHQPDLGVMRGTLEEVIREAIKTDGFWTWGGGGTISLAARLNQKEEVQIFLEEGIRERALAKLTDEEKEVLGLNENI